MRETWNMGEGMGREEGRRTSGDILVISGGGCMDWALHVNQ